MNDASRCRAVHFLPGSEVITLMRHMKEVSLNMVVRERLLGVLAGQEQSAAGTEGSGGRCKKYKTHVRKATR
jgi:hypothetical protein